MKNKHIKKNHTIKPLVYGIRTAIFTAGMAAVYSGAVLAGPTGGVVTAGTGQISNPNAQSTVINQSSQRLVANWQSFNIGATESVTFRQPNTSAIALNQILDQNPSQIFGSLNANGRVFLVNPNGMYFAPSASVNVGSLVATTLKIDSKKFMSGMNVFGDLNIPAGDSVIVNQGLLQAATGGSISLIAGEVRNEGVIVANLGHVNLASGRKATLDFDGDGLIQFEIQGNIEQNTSQAENAVLNSGEIIANGGQVLLTAAAAKDVFTNVVNNEGIIRANSIENRNGEIFLVGMDAGIVRDNGLLDVSGTDAGETGGTIKLLGEKVGLFNGAELNASGNAGGGEVLVGGNYQGNGEERNATVTFIDENTRIKADAIENGDGGKVIIWADDTTRFYGDISARGGSQSGDGGFVEVSGKNYLEYQGLSDLSADNGAIGTLLLDPGILNITSGNGTDEGFLSAPDNIFAALEGTATSNIRASYLVGQLDLADIILQALSTINVETAIDASANTNSHSLELDADTINFSNGADITLKNADLILGNTFAGNVVLLQGASVSLDTGSAGTITFASSINGTVDTAGPGSTDTAESLTLISGNGLIIPTLTLTGDLTATAIAGNLTDSGLVTVGGNASFITTATTGADITLGSLSVTKLTLDTKGNFDVNNTGLLTELAVTVDPSGMTMKTYDLVTPNVGGFVVTDGGSTLDINNVFSFALTTLSITTDTGDINVANINTPNTNVTLTSTAGNIQEVLDGTSVIKGNNLTLTAVALNQAIGATGTGALDIELSGKVDASANNGTGGIYLSERDDMSVGIGDMSVGIIDADNTIGGNVELTSTTGNIQEALDGTSVIRGNNLTLTANTLDQAIGAMGATGALDIELSGKVDASANNGTGGIYLSETDDMLVGVIDADNTSGGDVELTSTTGNIQEALNGTSVIRGSDLTLTAEALNQAIGATGAGALDIALEGQVDASANNGTGGIYLSESDDMSVGIIDADNTSGGNVELTSTTGNIQEALNGTSIIRGSDLTLTAEALNQAIGATGAGALDIALEGKVDASANNGTGGIYLSESGDMSIGIIDADNTSGGDVELTSTAGSIQEALNGTSVIRGNNLTLTAEALNQAIGATGAGALDIALEGQVDASANNGTGGIYLSESDDMSVGIIDADNTSGGNVELTSTTGNIQEALNGTSVIRGSDLTLTAEALNQAIGATGAGALDIALEGKVDASANNGTGGIYLSESGDMSVGIIDADNTSGGNVELTSTTGNIQEALDGTSVIRGNNLTLTAEALNQAIGATGAGALDIVLEGNVQASANTGTGGIYLSETDDMLVNLIDAGAGTVDITSVMGSINDHVSDPEAIVDIKGGALAWSDATGFGNTAGLEIEGFSGTLDLTIHTDTSFNISTGSTINNLVVILDPAGGALETYTLASSGLTFNVLDAGTALNIVNVSSTTLANLSFTTDTGNINVGTINTPNANVTVSSTQGSLVDATSDIRAVDLSLNANALNQSIGASGVGALDITLSGKIDASANDGIGGIYLSESNDMSVGIIDADNTSGGNVELTSTAGSIQEALNGTSVIRGNNLTLTAEALNQAIGATGTGALDIALESKVDASANNGTGGIYLSESDDMSVGIIDADNTSGGNVELTSTAGNIQEALNGTSIIRGSDLTLTAEALNQAIGATGAGALDIALEGKVDASANNGTGGIYLSESDDMSVGIIDADNTSGGNVELTSTAGSIQEALNGTSVIRGNNLTLTAEALNQAIGATGTGALDIALEGKVDASANNGTGGIYLSESDDMSVGIIDADNTSGGNVELTSTAGSIQEALNGTSVIRGNNLTLTAEALNQAIGATGAGALDIALEGKVDASANNGTGGIYLSESGDMLVGVIDADNTSGGNVELTSTAGSIQEALNGTSVIRGNNLTLTAEALNQAIGATGTGALDIALESKVDASANNGTGGIYLSESDDMLVGIIDADNTSGGNVELTSTTGNIQEALNGTSVIRGSDLTLTAEALNQAIGATGAGALDIALEGQVDASANNGTGGIYLSESDDMSVGIIDADNTSGGNVELTSTTGNIQEALNGTSIIRGSDLTLTAEALNQAIGATGAGALDIALEGKVDASANNGTGGIYLSESGDMSIGIIDADNTSGGDVELTSTAGSIQEALNGTSVIRGNNLTLTAEALNQAIGATGAGALDIALEGQVDASANNGTGGIYLSESDDMSVGIIDADNTSGGNVELTSTTGNIQEALNGTSVIRGSDLTLTAEALNQAIGATGAGALDIALEGKVDASANNGTGGIYLSESGDMSVGIIDADNTSGGNVELTSTTGNIQEALDGTSVIRGNNLTLTAEALNQAIGATGAGALDIVLEGNVQASANTGTGGIYLSETDDMLVNLIDAGAGTVDITSVMGSINDHVSDPEAIVDIKGGALAWSDATGFGNTAGLEIEGFSGTLDLTIDTDTSFNISTGSTINNLVVILDPAGGALETYTLASSGLTFNVLDAGTALNIVNVSSTTLANLSFTTDTGNINVGTINTPNANVTVSSTQGSLVDATSDIRAVDLSLNANALNQSIGASGVGALDITLSGKIDASANDGIGGIYLSESNDMSVGIIDADNTSGGNVELTSTAGSIQEALNGTSVIRGNNLTLTAEALNQAIGATGTGALDIALESKVDASANNGTGGIYLSESDDMSVGIIDADNTSGGNVELTSTAGNIQEALNGTSIIRGSDLTLTAEALNQAIGATGAGALDIALEGKVDASANNGTGGIYLSESDDMSVGIIDADNTSGGNVELTSTAGSIQEALNGTSVIRGNNLTLTAEALNQAIGATGTGALDIALEGKVDASANNGTGGIYLSESDDMSVGIIDADNTSGGNVELTSTAGSIQEALNGTSVIRGSDLTLTAEALNQAIGATGAGALDIALEGKVDASANNGTGGIYLSESGDMLVGVIDADNTSGGNVELTSTAGSIQEALNGTSVIRGNNLTLTAEALNQAIGATGAGALDIALEGQVDASANNGTGGIYLSESDDMSVGIIDADNTSGGNVELTSTTGNIQEALNGTSVIRGSDLTLTAEALNQAIGATGAGALDIALEGKVDASANNGTGGIYLSESGDMSVGIIDADNTSGGNVELTSTTGNIQEALDGTSVIRGNNLTLTAEALNQAIGATGAGALDIALEGKVDASANNGTGGIYLSESGDMSIGIIDADNTSGGDVELTSTTGNIQEALNGTSVIRGNNLTLTAEALNQAIGATGAGALDIALEGKVDASANNGTGGIYLSESGDMSVGIIDADNTSGGNVELTSTTGNIQEALDGTSVIRGNNLTLTAEALNQAIGATGAGALDIALEGKVDASANNGTGGIYLSESGDMSVGIIDADNTSGGNVELTSTTGNIQEALNGTSVIRGNNLTLTAEALNQAIGATGTGALDIALESKVDASANNGTGGIYLSESDDMSVGIIDADNTSGGNVELTSTAGSIQEALNGTSVIRGNNLTLTAEALNQAIGATGTGALDIALEGKVDASANNGTGGIYLSESDDMSVGIIDADNTSGGNVELTSTTGNIQEALNGTSVIKGNNLTLTAEALNQAIGATGTGALDIALEGKVDASANNGTGGIYLSESGDMSINSINTGTGNLELTSDASIIDIPAGTVSVGGVTNITAITSDVTLGGSGHSANLVGPVSITARNAIVINTTTATSKLSLDKINLTGDGLFVANAEIKREGPSSVIKADELFLASKFIGKAGEDLEVNLAQGVFVDSPNDSFFSGVFDLTKSGAFKFDENNVIDIKRLFSLQRGSLNIQVGRTSGIQSQSSNLITANKGRLIDNESDSAIDAALFDESVTMFSILDPGLLLPTDQLEGDEDEDEVAQGWYLEDKLQQNEAGQWEMQGASEMLDFSDNIDDLLTVSSNQ